MLAWNPELRALASCRGLEPQRKTFLANFVEDVDETGCKGLQLDDCSFVEGQRMSRLGALDLQAKLVPRGHTLSEASFEQHLSHAFLSTRGPVKVVMPWEKGVFKKIFKKFLMISCRTFSNSLVSGWGWMQCLKWKRVMSCRRLLAAGTNWSEPFMSMHCHQCLISPFCNNVKTFWRRR